MKVLVNKGTLLSEVRPLLLFAIVQQLRIEDRIIERQVIVDSQLIDC